MADPMTREELDAYLKLAENIRERFGDNWLIAFDPEYDDEASVRTEDSTPTFFTEMFVTSQVHGEDPLEVAGFLAAAIDNVPRMAAAIRQAEAERDRLAEQVDRAQDPDLIRRAIADPGAYVKRKLDHGEPAETVPAWGARAVIAALDGESGR
jgi:hypothetical protein